MFQEMFTEANGKPVQYLGRTIQMVDDLSIGNQEKLLVTFESMNSKWRQGVRLTSDGTFVVNEQRVQRGVMLWHDTAPTQVELLVESKAGLCHVTNVWDVGDDVVHYWHGGGAMIVETIEAGRRYLCNDGYPDDDFDDLVFTVELISE